MFLYLALFLVLCFAVGGTGQLRPPSTARILRETELGVTECSLVPPVPLGDLQSSHAHWPHTRISASSEGGGATTATKTAQPEKPERSSSDPDSEHLCSLPQASHRLSGPLEKNCARHMPQAPKVKHHLKGLSVQENTGGFPATFVLATALDGSLESRAPCPHATMQRAILKEKLLLRQTNPP